MPKGLGSTYWEYSYVIFGLAIDVEEDVDYRLAVGL